jgi:hypothetical protein
MATEHREEREPIVGRHRRLPSIVSERDPSVEQGTRLHYWNVKRDCLTCPVSLRSAPGQWVTPGEEQSMNMKYAVALSADERAQVQSLIGQGSTPA